MNIDVFVTIEDFEKIKKYAPRAVGDLVFIRDPRKRAIDISFECDKNRDWKFEQKTTLDNIKRIRYVTYNYLNRDQWKSFEEYERYDDNDQVKLFDHPDGYYKYTDRIGWFWYPTTLDKACTNATNELEKKQMLNAKEVIFNYPATIVYWEDGTKTVVKCSSEDEWDEEIGFALAYVKKQLGNKPNYNTYIRKILKNAKRYNDPETYSFTVYSDNKLIFVGETKEENK